MKVAEIFDDHMVLQAGLPSPVWGWAEAGAGIKVEFSGQTVETVANDNGFWKVNLKPMPPSFSPNAMTITDGKTEIKLEDILVGEVWLCAGQSNMGYPMMKLEREVEPVPGLRLFRCLPRQKPERQDDFAKGDWFPADKDHNDAMENFSIIGFLFGKDMREKLNVPIGMIDISRAASVAESWTPVEDLRKMEAYPEIKRELEKIDTSDFNAPGYLYNNAVNPLVTFGIAGVLWYQGESNSIRAEFYGELVKTMLTSWRRRWKQGDFHFLSVQLPNYDNSKETPPCCSGSWARMREEQSRILELENTALVVTIDIGDSEDLHPANKPEVARRLALAALGARYGQDIEHSGPTYKSMNIEGSVIRLEFDHAETGLTARNGALRGFEIAGEDGRFFPAEAEIDGNSVIVRDNRVKKPTAVRYAWNNNPEGCDLYNREGLPAAPFRTNSPNTEKTLLARRGLQ